MEKRKPEINTSANGDVKKGRAACGQYPGRQ